MGKSSKGLMLFQVQKCHTRTPLQKWANYDDVPILTPGSNSRVSYFQITKWVVETVTAMVYLTVIRKQYKTVQWKKLFAVR